MFGCFLVFNFSLALRNGVLGQIDLGIIYCMEVALVLFLECGDMRANTGVSFVIQHLHVFIAELWVFFNLHTLH